MKKMLIIALALGLAVTMAAPAMATDWSARGHIFIGGAIHRTVPPAAAQGWGFVPGPPPGTLDPVPGGTPAAGGDGWNDTFAWMKMGANLTITMTQSEDLYGVLGFNMNSRRWGEAGNQATVNEMGSWYRLAHDDSGTLSVLVNEAFIDFRVPPKLPVWLRMGIQPFVIRPWLVVMTNGPGITARTMIDPIKLGINLGWAKKWEGYDWDCDDVDAFTADVNMPIGPVRVGSFVWYENHNQWWPTDAGVFDSGARDEADIYWVGFYADGRIGPVGLQFDWVYNGGEIKYDASGWGGAPPQDQDIRAWVIRGVLDVSPMDKLMVGIGALYSTGEDLSTNDLENYESVGGWDGVRAQGYPAMQDFLLMTGGVMGIVPSRGPMVAYLGGPVSMGGLWYVRGFAQYMATDWLRLIANFGYIGDTVDDGNKLGTAWDPTEVTGLRDDDEIGFEMDFGFNIALYKNLQWGVAFGYLFAGNALDRYSDPAWVPNAGTGTNEDPNDPWCLMSAILYTF
jgi:hypothetical protein